MTAAFPFKLLTPASAVYEGAVAAVTAVGAMGQFGVLAEHINLIAALEPGILEIRLADGTARRYVLAGGLAEVVNGAMTVLAETVEEPAALTTRPDLDAALVQAEAKLAGMSAYAEEYEEAHRDLMLARARKEAGQLAAPPR